MICLKFSRQIGRIRRLSSVERSLLLQIVGLVIVVRAALWLITFRRLQSLLSRVEVRGIRNLDIRAIPVERVAQFVAAASRYVPKASCLTQALVTATMLRRAGHGASLRIGVSPHAGAKFRAHAWVECDGKIVIGRIKDFEDFAPLPPVQMGNF